jgi:hypothetical protein
MPTFLRRAPDLKEALSHKSPQGNIDDDCCCGDIKCRGPINIFRAAG